MKNTVKIISILLVFVICIIALASCEKSGTLEDYKSRLEGAKYEVEFYSEGAIKASNEELKGDGLNCTVVAGIYAVFVESGKETYETATIIEFETKSQAKTYITELKKSYGQQSGIVREGAFVVFGTEKGINTALGK